mmetsp:Transcript_1114/g.1010  ORF Transcript_1114/g.1010 Transcript_1114/m.1010 type:complete len:91 (+) Transcript_1114:1450-1722(+)
MNFFELASHKSFQKFWMKAQGGRKMSEVDTDWEDSEDPDDCVTATKIFKAFRPLIQDMKEVDGHRVFCIAPKVENRIVNLEQQENEKIGD